MTEGERKEKAWVWSESSSTGVPEVPTGVDGVRDQHLYLCSPIKKTKKLLKAIFAYAKTKARISCAVTAQIISAFVFAARIKQFLFFVNPKFQVSSHLL